jgi:hypothetical protein
MISQQSGLMVKSLELEIATLFVQTAMNWNAAFL